MQATGEVQNQVPSQQETPIEESFFTTDEENYRKR